MRLRRQLFLVDCRVAAIFFFSVSGCTEGSEIRATFKRVDQELAQKETLLNLSSAERSMPQGDAGNLSDTAQPFVAAPEEHTKQHSELVEWWLADGSFEGVMGSVALASGAVVFEPGRRSDQNVSDKAFTFGGKSFLRLDHRLLERSPEEFTLSFWLKTSQSSEMVVLESIDMDQSVLRLSINANGALTALSSAKRPSSQDERIQIATSNIAVNDGKWHIVYLVRKNEKLSLNVGGVVADGSEISSVTSVNSKGTIVSAIGSKATLLVGSSQRAGSESTRFRGALEDLQVYSRALEPSEILSQISSGNELKPMIANGSFEEPQLPPGAVHNAPNPAGWLFTGNSGIVGADSNKFELGLGAFDGDQMAFLDPGNVAGEKASSIETTLFLDASGHYVLTLALATALHSNRRDTDQESNADSDTEAVPQVIVAIDERALAQVKPRAGQFEIFRSEKLNLGQGSHVVSIRLQEGNSAIRSSVLVDSVSLIPVDSLNPKVFEWSAGLWLDCPAGSASKKFMAEFPRCMARVPGGSGLAERVDDALCDAATRPTGELFCAIDGASEGPEVGIRKFP